MACPSSMAKLFCALLFAVAWCPCASAWTLADIRLPPGGFQVEYFSRGVPNARSMALSTGITQLNLVYVSTRSRRNIYAVIDENKDGVADAVHTLLDNLATPNGIAYLNGALFVAQVNRWVSFSLHRPSTGRGAPLEKTLTFSLVRYHIMYPEPCTSS
jgi:hypothetical protein